MAGNGEKGEPFNIEEHMINLERLGTLKLLARMSDDQSIKEELSRLDEKVRTGHNMLKKLAFT